MQQIVITETWRDRIEELIARTRENRLLLACIAVVAGVALLLWSRAPAARVAPAARAASFPAAAPSVGVPAVVHVAGAVRRPGLYEFPAGARIADAIETAGGALRAADLGALNLAEPLVDGAQIHVPVKGSPAAAAPGSPSSAPSATPTVPLNAADTAALETIPGVGPVTATAIVEHRERIGSFTSVDELLDVDGIGPATLEAIRPYVTL